jgi:tetratricopeptide (TPR) repeat protein
VYKSQRDDAERCLGLARQLKEPGIEVMALRMLGLALTRLGNHDLGIALCEQALAVAQDNHEPAWEYLALATLAYSAGVAGRHELAERYCRMGIDANQRLGLYLSGQGYLLGMLGDSYTGRGRYREGVDAFSRAMALFEEYQDRRGQALCLLKLGQAHIALGEPQRATEVLQRCFPMFGELGLPVYEDMVIKALDQCRPTTEATLADTP